MKNIAILDDEPNNIKTITINNKTYIPINYDQILGKYVMNKIVPILNMYGLPSLRTVSMPSGS